MTFFVAPQWVESESGLHHSCLKKWPIFLQEERKRRNTMRSSTYLNTMLTLIAILLTLHLWTLWTMPVGLPHSQATLDLATPVHAAGLPNAGMQRKQTIDLLKELLRKTEGLSGLFRSGQARVRVEQSPEKTAR